MGVVRTLIPWLVRASLVMSAAVVSAQDDPATAAARAWRLQHESAILDEFMRFLAIPNVTTDRDGISRNAAALSAMLRARGITPQLLSVPHPQVASLRFTAAGNATRTPMDGPAAQAVIRAVERVRGPVLKLPTMGGSLPLEPVARLLGMPLINIHLSNPDSNNHSFDENLRLGNLWDGIEQAAALLLMDVPSR